jgi:hypothetical protein
MKNILINLTKRQVDFWILNIFSISSSFYDFFFRTLLVNCKFLFVRPVLQLCTPMGYYSHLVTNFCKTLFGHSTIREFSALSTTSMSPAGTTSMGTDILKYTSFNNATISRL